MTVSELNFKINCFAEKEKATLKNGIVASFYSAYFQRIEKLSSKDLQSVLNNIDNKTQSTAMKPEDMFEAVKKLIT
jgi:hypothetical protein